MAASSRFLLGRYQLGSLLGTGGMAEVFEGHDQILARRVAVKVLYSQYSRDPAFVTRFKREARTAASISHPNIVSIYDTGEHDGTHFIVMEYVDGRSLAEVIEQDGALDVARAVRIGLDSCSALSAAHARGLIHRDVKPGNIMVTPRDQVKVTDFGIARIATSPSITETAKVVGTARYMSPEQARALEVDARADIYSLGVCLYEMLTGQPPFDGDSPILVAARHVGEAPRPPRQLRAEIPPELEAIVLRAMSKRPDDRYQSAAELRDALSLAASGQIVPVASSGRVQVGQVTAGAVSVAGMSTVPGRSTAEGRPGAQRRAAALIGAVGGMFLALLTVLALVQPAGSSATGGIGGIGAERRPMPYVARRDEQAARALLIGDGFTVASEVIREQSDIPASLVIGTRPAAGTIVSVRDPVVLVVSEGRGGVQVPSVLDQPVDAATRYLQSLGFQVETVEAFSGQADGTVIGQDPRPNTLVGEPGTVTLTVAGSQRDRQSPAELPVPAPPTTGPRPTSPPVTSPPTTQAATTSPPTTQAATTTTQAGPEEPQS